MQAKTLVLAAAMAALLALPTATAGAQLFQNAPANLSGKAQDCKVVGNVVVLTGFTGTINGVQGTWTEIVFAIVQGGITCHGALPGPWDVTTRPGTVVSGAAYQ